MAKGLPKSYIKKWGISKKAWSEYRKKHPKKGSKPKKINPGRKGPAKKSNPSGGRVTKKRPSLSGILAVGGIALLVTGIGAKAVGDVMGHTNVMLREIGVHRTVTGGTLLAGALIMKGASSLFPNFIGKKWRGFLSGYGLRP